MRLLSTNHGYWLEKMIFGLATAAFAAMAVDFLMRPPTSDTGWLLFAARQALEGKAFYTDLAETNPPLILWYKMLAVWLSPSTGSDMATFTALVLLVSLISVSASCQIVKRAGVLSGRGLWCYAAMLTAIALPLASHEMVFAQREHLVILFCLPYLTYSIPQVFSNYQPSRSSIILMAGWAAMGLLLKPHFIMLFLAIEAAFLVLMRRIDNRRFLLGMVVGLLGAAYALAVWMWVPAYFTEIVPDMLRTYDAHRHVDRIIYSRLLNEFSFWFALVPFIICLPRYFWNMSMLPAYAAILAGIAIVLVQDKGWNYTYYPLRAALYLALACLFWGVLNQASSLTNKVQFKKPIAMITAILAIVAVGYQFAPAEWFRYLLYAYIPLAIAFLYGITQMHQDSATFSIWRWVFWLSFLPALGIMGAYFALLRIPNQLLLSFWLGVFMLSWLNLWLEKQPERYPSQELMSAQTLIFFWLLLMVPAGNYVRGELRVMLFERGLSELLADAIMKQKPESIYFFNTNLYPAWPLSATLGTKWAGRYHHLWMLPALYDEPGCMVKPGLADIEARMMRHLEEDFRKYRPDVLIFDTSPRKFLSNNVQYDYRLCMAKRPGLAQVLEHYERVSTVDICTKRIKLNCSYDIYRKSQPY